MDARVIIQQLGTNTRTDITDRIPRESFAKISESIEQGRFLFSAGTLDLKGVSNADGLFAFDSALATAGFALFMNIDGVEQYRGVVYPTDIEYRLTQPLTCDIHAYAWHERLKRATATAPIVDTENDLTFAKQLVDIGLDIVGVMQAPDFATRIDYELDLAFFEGLTAAPVNGMDMQDIWQNPLTGWVYGVSSEKLEDGYTIRLWRLRGTGWDIVYHWNENLQVLFSVGFGAIVGTRVGVCVVSTGVGSSGAIDLKHNAKLIDISSITVEVQANGTGDCDGKAAVLYEANYSGVGFSRRIAPLADSVKAPVISHLYSAFYNSSLVDYDFPVYSDGYRLFKLSYETSGFSVSQIYRDGRVNPTGLSVDISAAPPRTERCLGMTRNGDKTAIAWVDSSGTFNYIDDISTPIIRTRALSNPVETIRDSIYTADFASGVTLKLGGDLVDRVGLRFNESGGLGYWVAVRRNVIGTPVVTDVLGRRVSTTAALTSGTFFVNYPVNVSLRPQIDTTDFSTVLLSRKYSAPVDFLSVLIDICQGADMRLYIQDGTIYLRPAQTGFNTRAVNEEWVDRSSYKLKQNDRSEQAVSLSFTGGDLSFGTDERPSYIDVLSGYYADIFARRFMDYELVIPWQAGDSIRLGDVLSVVRAGGNFSGLVTARELTLGRDGRMLKLVAEREI